MALSLAVAFLLGRGVELCSVSQIKAPGLAWLRLFGSASTRCLFAKSTFIVTSTRYIEIELISQAGTSETWS